MRKMFIAGLLILALAGGALAGDGVEILGLTHQEVVEVLGRPAYIKVFDYGPAQKYAYFTLDEWEMIGDLAPLAQGRMSTSALWRGALPVPWFIRRFTWAQIGSAPSSGWRIHHVPGGRPEPWAAGCLRSPGELLLAGKRSVGSKSMKSLTCRTIIRADRRPRARRASTCAASGRAGRCSWSWRWGWSGAHPLLA